MLVKENNLLVNILAFITVIVLLVPYSSLFGDIRFIPMYDLVVVKVYMGLVMALFLTARLLQKRNILTKSVFELLNKTGVFYYVCGLVLATIATLDVIDIMSVFFAASFIMAGLVFYIVSKRFGIEKSMKIALITSTIYGIVVSIVEFYFYGFTRPGGLMGNANVWSAYLAFILPICIYGVKKSQYGIDKVLYAIITFGVIICILLAKSRALFVAFGFVACCYLIKKLYFYKKCYFYIVLFATVLIIAIAFPKLQQLLMSRDYDKDRFNAYITAIKMFCDYPIIGVGYSHFKEMYALKYTPLPNIEVLPHAHCLYLQYLATTGIVGFTGLMCFVVKFVKYLYNQGKTNSYYYCGLVGMFLFIGHGIFDSTISNLFFYRVFWLFFVIYNIDIFTEDKVVED